MNTLSELTGLADERRARAEHRDATSAPVRSPVRPPETDNELLRSIRNWVRGMSILFLVSVVVSGFYLAWLLTKADQYGY